MSTKFLEHKLEFPSRFVELKQQLVPTTDSRARKRLTAAWTDLLNELAASTKLFKEKGSDLIPQVNFIDLPQLSLESVANIKKRGCVIIRNVVDDAEALGWKQSIKDYIAANPSFSGLPEGGDNKQFYFMYWSKAQIQARSHPNVLASQKWLNALYHVSQARDGVSLEIPLAYADSLRIRDPGPLTWLISVPHVDGGSIERWEDPGFTKVYNQIFEGNWRQHDPYHLDVRLNLNSDMYNRPHQASVFRTFQGWLSMSDTGPGEGTLQVFPDVVLSSAYITLRPFFRPVATPVSDDPLEPSNWEFDTSSPDFPGVYPVDEFFSGLWLTTESHPHLKLEDTMISILRVKPGDMVYWHCDVIHSVEQEHRGTDDSSVMYIPAVPNTPRNAAYVERQKEQFLREAPPPDFPQDLGEVGFRFVATEKDITYPAGRRAMGFPAMASAT